MNRILPLLKLLGKVTLVFVVFAVLLISMDPFSGRDEIMIRFVTGFWYFLGTNIPKISWNADSLVPGVGAFVIALICIHRWMGRWARKTGRAWSFWTSLCLVSLVPVCFVISFIVPGVLLQWEALLQVEWLSVNVLG